jgi:hypothetical protein
VVHKKNKREAAELLQYLPVFLQERFGDGVWNWFGTNEENMMEGHIYDPQSFRVIEPDDDSEDYELDGFSNNGDVIETESLASAEIPRQGAAAKKEQKDKAIKIDPHKQFHFDLPAGFLTAPLPRPKKWNGDDISFMSGMTGASESTAGDKQLIDLGADSEAESAMDTDDDDDNTKGGDRQDSDEEDGDSQGHPQASSLLDDGIPYNPGPAGLLALEDGNQADPSTAVVLATPRDLVTTAANGNNNTNNHPTDNNITHNNKPAHGAADENADTASLPLSTIDPTDGTSSTASALTTQTPSPATDGCVNA